LKTKIFLIVFLILMALAAVLFVLKEGQKNPAGGNVCVNKKCYSVEMAKTPEQWRNGLMNRASLDKNGGMLFVLPESGNYSFWMKNTLIPLDIIWIDANLRIVSIARAAQPCVEPDYCALLDPGINARYVLEVNAGQMDAIGAKIGDIANIVF
jgi:uncharacterized membrane protein (UPF0127 family)